MSDNNVVLIPRWMLGMLIFCLTERRAELERRRNQFERLSAQRPEESELDYVLSMIGDYLRDIDLAADWLNKAENNI